MFRKIIAVALLCAFACFGALSEAATEEAVPAFTGVWQDPAFGRASMKILPCTRTDLPEGEEWFDIALDWGSSAESTAQWTMSARFDAGTCALAYGDGAMVEVVYDESGNVVSENAAWSDAAGALTMTADGKLRWTDSREARAAEFAFERQPQTAPTAGELSERYVLPASRLEKGTAGASLKLAEAACAIARYAWESDLWNADADKLSDNLQSAWEALDEDARARFIENITDLMECGNAAFGSFAEVEAQFNDAGAGEQMAALVQDEAALLSWEALMDATLFMQAIEIQ